MKIERDAQELADSLGVRIFQADIIYHLFDKFMAYREELKQKKREEFKKIAVFPCKLKILPQVGSTVSILNTAIHGRPHQRGGNIYLMYDNELVLFTFTFVLAKILFTK